MRFSCAETNSRGGRAGTTETAVRVLNDIDLATGRRLDSEGDLSSSRFYRQNFPRKLPVINCLVRYKGTTAPRMHDPEREKAEGILVRGQAVKGGRGWAWDNTCVITHSFEPICSLSDGTGNRRSSDDSERSNRHNDPCPPPSIGHVTHHHGRHYKQRNICSGTEPVDDRDCNK